MEHKRAVIVCFIGGALMMFGSVFGSVGFLGKLLSLASGYVDPGIEAVLQNILTVFGFIAAGGGISVMVGAIIAGYGPDRVGRLVAGFGIGAGLISLIILLIMNFVGGGAINDVPTVFLTAFNNVYGLAGVLIAIFGRMRLKD
jgi:hypothetical protein